MVLYETERLVVKEWEMKDAKDLYEYVSLDAVTKFLSFPTYNNIEQAYNRIKEIQEKYICNEKCSDYPIVLKNENKVIGQIGIVNYSPNIGGIIELGYILNPKYQHKGYMTEALIGFFKYIKVKQLAKRIELKHNIKNIASGNVMKKAGMTFEGILRKSDQSYLNARTDLALYSILEEEIN